MAIRFSVDLEKLRRTTWGHGQVLANTLGISRQSLSQKLNGKQALPHNEINTIFEALNLDARDFVFFIDTQKKAEIRGRHEYEI